MLGFGIGLMSASRGVDVDAQAWAAAVVANSGTVSPSTLRAVSNFARSCKAAGIWTKLNRVNLFCGNQLAAALVPLKVGSGSATDTNVNFVSGDYTEATGLTGNGSSKYLKTGVIPSAALVANSTHLSVYNRSSSTGAANMLAIGCRIAADRFDIYGPFTDGTVYADQYNNTVGGGRISAAASAPFGFIVSARTGAAAQAIYRNGASLASSVTTGGTLASVTSEVTVFGHTYGGGAMESYSAHTCAAYSIGTGLTASEVAAYNTIMEQFQDALGRGVQ